MAGMRQFDGLGQVALSPGPVHLAIGIFDGVHLGHQSVIEAAVHSARRDGGWAGVLTFWPHPSDVLRPDRPAKLLMAPEIKRRVLAGLGLDFLVEQPFTLDYARTTAAEFVALLKRSLPGLAAVYVGENWKFGRGQEGNVALLVAAARAHGFSVYSAPRLNHNGQPISSSRIRELVAAGEIAQANALLGYTYFCEAVVQRGRQLGRTIGFPTLNLRWSPSLAPKFGVYAVSVTGPDGRRLPGVANYGVRPTVETGAVEPLLEVHVLAPTTLTYGEAVKVQWLAFLRPELKFPGLDELRRQIGTDRESALSVLGKLVPQDLPKSA